jgi:hypothetical protein
MRLRKRNPDCHTTKPLEAKASAPSFTPGISTSERIAQSPSHRNIKIIQIKQVQQSESKKKQNNESRPLEAMEETEANITK